MRPFESLILAACVAIPAAVSITACDDEPGDADADVDADADGDTDSDADVDGDGDADGDADADADADVPPDPRTESAMGMGLGGIADWSTQYPFIDLMRWSREWHDWSADAPITSVDEQGWVTSLGEGEVAGTVFLTNPEGIPIQYPRLVVRWSGSGTIGYDWGARRTGESHGGDLVEVGEGSCLLEIESTDPSDPIRDISIVPEEQVAAFDAGQVFNPDWLARIQGFRAIRFMDWMATNGSTQSEWSGRPVPEDRTWAPEGVPLEVMVDLANELDADPWLNIPHLATDEYVTRFAEYVRDHLEPQLVAYVEHSNEVWNWGFEQAQHANEQGRARWGDVGDAYMQWHGMRTAQICDIWKLDVFAGATERVHCVLGTQTGWRGLEEPALQCPLWAAEGNAPCYQHGIDSLGVTGYFSGCLHGESGWPVVDYTETIRGWFSDGDGGMARGLEQALDGRHFECDDTVAGLADTYAYFRDVAGALGLAIVAYEGGQHITGNGHPIQDDPDFIEFHTSLNRREGMGDLYDQNFASWRDSGGTLFMHFVDIGTYGRYGSWGALEYLGQPTSPKWSSIVAFNAEPCFWEGC